MPTLKSQKRVRIATETSGAATFGIELSGSIGSFIDLHALSAEPAALPTSMLRDEGVVQRRYQRRKSIAGETRPTCDLRAYLSPPAIALGVSATPAATPEDALGKLLYTMLGGFEADAGSTEAGASTASVVNVTGGQGVRFAEGAAYGVAVAGKLEARMIADITTDAITPMIKHSAAPTSSAVVYNAYSYYLTEDPNRSLQLIVEAADRDDIHWLLGGNGVPAFEINLSQFPILTSQLMFANGAHDDAVTTPIGSAAIAVSTFTDKLPIPFLSSEVRFGTGSAPQNLVVLDCTISITPNWTIEPLPSPSGVNGVKRWMVIPGDPTVNAEIITEGYGTTYRAALDAGTEYSLEVQIGNSAPGTILFALPNLQIVDVEPAEYAKLVGEKITLQTLEGGRTGGTSDLAYSPFSIHRL